MLNYQKIIFIILIVLSNLAFAESYFVIADKKCLLKNNSVPDIDSIYAWVDKAHNIQNCDRHTIMFLLKNRLIGMKINILNNLRVDADNYNFCKININQLFAERKELVWTLKDKLEEFDRKNCPEQEPTDLYKTYITQIKVGVNVRSSPLTGINSNRKDKLKLGQQVTLIDKIIGNDSTEWGHFVYEKDGQPRSGWIRMDLVARTR